MKFYSFTALLFSLLMTVSCTKDYAPEPTPTPDPDPQPTLFESIQGKWNINAPASRISAPKTSGKIQEEKTLVSLEFLSDSTYIVTLNNGEMYSGKIEINDSTTINLYQLGIITDIKFTGETSLSFNISSDGWGSYTVVTTKAPVIPETSETALICKKWDITATDRGPATFGFYGGFGDTHLHLLFTKSGTYYVKTFHLDTVYNVHSCTWKWHPSKANTFIYTNEGKDSEVTITELTDHSLKMEEDYTDSWSQQSVHQKYSFVPAD